MTQSAVDLMNEIEWLDKHAKDYVINADGTIDARKVIIEMENISEIPFKFNNVFAFEVNNVPLTSLKNCPTYCARIKINFTSIKSTAGLPQCWIHSNGEKMQILEIDLSNNYDLVDTKDLVDARFISLSNCPLIEYTEELKTLDYKSISKIIVCKELYKIIKKNHRNIRSIDYDRWRIV